MYRYYQPRFGAQNTTEAAAHFDSVLRERMLPYWYRTVLDHAHGGYVLADMYRPWRAMVQGARYRLKQIGKVTAPRPATARTGRHVVSQARMLWSFAHVHALGYSDGEHDYERAAAHGYDFLTRQMTDSEHGGVYWKVSPSGQVLDSRKMLFGQVYVIFALTEYHRASRLDEPLARALTLFRLVQDTMHDARNGGWTEQTARDFGAMPLGGGGEAGNFLENVGVKTSYAMMHTMEAFAELYEASRDTQVRAALEEVVRIARTKFYTPDLANRRNLLTPDWQLVEGLGDEGFSPGHELEFAWLVLRAQRVLGIPLAWDWLETCLDHTLEIAFDRKQGGFFHDTSSRPTPGAGKKTWWVQAEGLCALTDALMHQAKEEYEAAIMRHLSWIWNHQMLGDGVWVWSTDGQGNITNYVKAHEWKEPYHETRALLKLIGAFAPAREPALPAMMSRSGR